MIGGVDISCCQREMMYGVFHCGRSKEYKVSCRAITEFI
jgi:hypothetical protein